MPDPIIPATIHTQDPAALLDRVGLTPEDLAAYCDRWRIIEFALFGSILRDDFRADSDLDCLVQFAPDARISRFEPIEMQHELGDRIGRSVDIVMRSDIDRSPNPITRREILSTAQTVYESEPARFSHPARCLPLQPNSSGDERKPGP